MDVYNADLNKSVEEHNRHDSAGPGVIESAFGLLEVLCALSQARVSDLVAESGLPRTTVHRLLGQLAAVRAVEKSGAYYRLGAGLLVLGQHVTPMERLRALAQRPLIELAAGSAAHAYLAATTSNAPIFLDTFSGLERLTFQLAPGDPMPSRSAGARALAIGRDVVVDDGDAITGVSCAAAAIPLPGGVAAVGVVVPLPQLPRSLLGPLRGTAQRVNALLAALTPMPVKPDRE